MNRLSRNSGEALVFVGNQPAEFGGLMDDGQSLLPRLFGNASELLRTLAKLARFLQYGLQRFDFRPDVRGQHAMIGCADRFSGLTEMKRQGFF